MKVKVQKATMLQLVYRFINYLFGISIFIGIPVFFATISYFFYKPIEGLDNINRLLIINFIVLIIIVTRFILKKVLTNKL